RPTEREPAAWPSQRRHRGPTPASRERKPRSLIEISSVAHLRRHVGSESILTHRVIDRGVAVDPDGIIVVADGVLVLGAGPLTLQRGRLVEHIPQSEHEPGPPAGAQRFQDWVELPQRSPRDVAN